MDLFYFFIHRSIDLLKEDGIFGMITTNYFITADGGIKLRNDLKKRVDLLNLLNLNELKVFESAKGQHNLITFFKKKSNAKPPKIHTIFVNRNETSNENIFNEIINYSDNTATYSTIPQNEIYDTEKNYIRIPKYNNSDIINDIFNKILKDSKLLGDITKVSQGIITGADKVSQRHINNLNLKDISKNEGVYVLSKQELDSLNLTNEELDLIKPFFKNSDINKYYTNEIPEKFLVYVTRDLNINNYPHIKQHLNKYSKIIKNRSKDRGEIKAALKLGKWWVIFASRNDTNFDGEKIVVPQRSVTNTFGYNNVKWYGSADVYFITNKIKQEDVSLKYILCLLNSKLYYFWLINKSKTKGNLLELLYTPLTEIPIKIISLNEQEVFVNLADDMIDLVSKLHEYKSPHEIQLIEKQIKITEDKINKLVYKLYDLTDDEIKIIEENKY